MLLGLLCIHLLNMDDGCHAELLKSGNLCPLFCYVVICTLTALQHHCSSEHKQCKGLDTVGVQMLSMYLVMQADA